jgi:hypothetical protein
MLLLLGKYMYHQSTAEELTSLYRNWESIHKKWPISKARTKIVRIDKDHPTDEKVKIRIYTTK